MTVLSTIPLTTTTNETTTETPLNAALKEINGVLRNAIDNKTVLNENEIGEVLGAIRGVLETITETTANENEVLIDTLFSVENNDTIEESKTWTEPCFLDRMNASQVLKEWADRTTDQFIELYSEDMWDCHPDQTAVRVPVQFHRELRNIGIQTQRRTIGNYLWEGIWYFPADMEFLEIVEGE